MAGNKNSGRKPDLSKTNSPHLVRRKRAEQAKENNKDFKTIGNAPSHLSKTGKKLYKEIAKELTEKGLVVNLDKTLLTVFVENVELSRTAEESILTDGILITGTNGDVKKNPAVDVKNNADRQIKSIGSSLGLDPMSRANLLSTKPADEPNNEMTEFMKLVGGAGG